MSVTIADKLIEAAQNEQRIYKKGYDKGVADAGGTDDGSYDEGYADGRQAEYDAFWDAYQQNGNRAIYNYAFSGGGWNDYTFVPKYDIIPTHTYHLFSETGIVDVAACLKRAGVMLDTSKATSSGYMAQSSEFLETLPVISLIGRKNIDHCIFACKKLKTIEKVIIKADGSQPFNDYSFNDLPALEEIRFEGVIGKAGFNIKWSTKLSHDSIVSIIYALSLTTSGLAITLSKAAVNKAFETSSGANDGSNSEEFADLCIERDNWTITLV